MTSTRQDSEGLAPVFDLVCRRFEEDIAEGRLDDAGKAHLKDCARCAGLWAEMERVGALIAEATGPVARVPDGFLDAVLLRADSLDGRIVLPGERTPRTRWQRIAPWAGGLAAAALLVAAFWAGAAQRAESVATSPRLVKGHQSPTPSDGDSVARAEEAPTLPAAPRERMKLAPVPEPVATVQPVPAPVVVPPQELRQVILQRLEAQGLCPASGGHTIHLTITVLPDGSLTNRQMLSSGDAAASHRCVSLALDGLQLPPTGEASTVTLELAW